MTQTSTPCSNAALKTPEKPGPAEALGPVPSPRTLQNILDFSRSLEVRTSVMLQHVHYLKS